MSNLSIAFFKTGELSEAEIIASQRRLDQGRKFPLGLAGAYNIYEDNGHIAELSEAIEIAMAQKNKEPTLAEHLFERVISEKEIRRLLQKEV